MRRLTASFAIVVALVTTAWAASLPAAQREASIAYLRAAQNADGGYRASAATGPSQLAATVPALRGVHHFGDELRGREGTLRFVKSCYDAKTGTFADGAGGTADVRSTAMGLMALAELKAPVSEVAGPVTTYFEANAKTLPDIYIAEAALDAAGLRPRNPQPWLEAYTGSRNPDGTYGKAPADAARYVITTLRLGEKVRDRAGLVRLLRSAQRPDGGFSPAPYPPMRAAPAPGDTSELPTTYPMMRALFMLHERPDLARLREFVAKCRNADGGYGPAPGQPSTTGATYYASIVLDWADQLEK